MVIRVPSYGGQRAPLTHYRASSPKLEFPNEEVAPARNNRPVVLLHGTLVEKDGIEAYRDYALQSGHPVSHKTYTSITKGHRIEKSTELASQEVNRSRAEVTAKNLEAFKPLNREELSKALQMDANLYGKHDPSVDLALDHMPELLTQVESLLQQPSEDIDSKLSGQLSRLEESFSKKLEKAGVDTPKAQGIAEELLDTVAPKAVLIGHSAGGYAAFNMVVNPEVTPDNDKFTYDGGNGVAEALIISSPIEEGLAKPAPAGVAELPFYNYEKSVLRPLENMPISKLAMMNPFAAAMYEANKSWLKSLTAANFMVATSLSSPILYAARPGNQQVEEGSDFFETYINDKPIPDGVSVTTYTSPLDRLSEEKRSALVTDQANGHSFSMDLQVSDEDLERERPTWTHVIMTEKPHQFEHQYTKAITSDAGRLTQILDPVNDEGKRYDALTELKLNPELMDNSEVKSAVRDVAKEELPFRDSASYLASQLLK